MLLPAIFKTELAENTVETRRIATEYFIGYLKEITIAIKNNKPIKVI